MYPLAMQSGARHRRELSTRQRVRAAAIVLMVLALIAAFGVFGGTVLGGESGQARVLKTISDGPISLRIAGWALYAVPVAGLFGLIMPTRSRLIRLFSLLLLVPGIVAMVAMSKPRGMSNADWKAALATDGVDVAAFVESVQMTSYALMAILLLWAMISALGVALARRATFDDLVAKVRRSAFWVAPLTIGGSLAAVLVF